MSDEPHKVFLGTIETGSAGDPAEAIAVVVPPNATADQIAAAIERANNERAEAQARETKRLRELFLDEDKPA